MRSVCGLSPPDYSSRTRTRCLAILISDFAGTDRVAVTLRILQQPAPPRRQIRGEIGKADRECFEIDNVDVGLLSRRQAAPIFQSEAARRSLGLHMDRRLD